MENKNKSFVRKMRKNTYTKRHVHKRFPELAAYIENEFMKLMVAKLIEAQNEYILTGKHNVGGK